MKFNYGVTKDLTTFGLAMSGGLGLTLIIVFLAVSAIAGESAAYLVSLALTVGAVLMIIGIGGWLIIVQPWRKFDDINQPLDDGHGHAHAAEPPADEHAIVVHDTSASAVEPQH